MNNFIVIKSKFGHEIMAVNFAKAFDMPVVIIPDATDETEFDTKSKDIYETMRFFYDYLVTIRFAQREEYLNQSWDIIGELKSNKLPDSMWNTFAASKLTPTDTANLPLYRELEDKMNILFVPQKLQSDGECGVTAEQQSVSPAVFNFFKALFVQFVLGQHFHKVNDLPIVEDLAKEFGLYVPGMTENPEVFGIRGVAHKLYYNMYASLSGSVGIAGTHTWLLLTLFPEIPQIILYNKKGVENWEAIGTAYRNQGYKIYTLGFDENTNMEVFSQQIEELYHKLF